MADEAVWSLLHYAAIGGRYAEATAQDELGPEAEEQAECAAADGEDEALGHAQAHDSSARGAEGEAIESFYNSFQCGSMDAEQKEALRAGLEPAFVPRRVVHVEARPREATGKLTVAALRAWALAPS